MTDSLLGASASLEAPTMVSAAGGAAVMAIIEQLSGTQCQMRSVNDFAVGAEVDFSIVIHGTAPISLRGKITARTQNGPRWKYTVGLETTAASNAAIVHAVQVARSRMTGRGPDVQTGNGLTRAAVRIPVDFEVHYTVAGGSPQSARATNVSTGGILINTAAQLAVGASLELRFLLGATPVSIKGRIVAHQATSPNYNIAFYDVREIVRETLARFVAEHERKG